MPQIATVSVIVRFLPPGATSVSDSTVFKSRSRWSESSARNQTANDRPPAPPTTVLAPAPGARRMPWEPLKTHVRCALSYGSADAGITLAALGFGRRVYAASGAPGPACTAWPVQPPTDALSVMGLAAAMMRCVTAGQVITEKKDCTASGPGGGRGGGGGGGDGVGPNCLMVKQLLS